MRVEITTEVVIIMTMMITMMITIMTMVTTMNIVPVGISIFGSDDYYDDDKGNYCINITTMLNVIH